MADDQAPNGKNNLALAGNGGVARSWEPGSVSVPEHEPHRVNDASTLTHWLGRAENMPVDIGIEWTEMRNISAVAVRYLDARLLPDYVGSRLQKWARLQYWDGSEWIDVRDPHIYGQGTVVNWYEFPQVRTARIRLLYATPFTYTGRTFEMRNSILATRTPLTIPPAVYVCQLEAYESLPIQVVDQLLIEPEPTRVFSDDLRPTQLWLIACGLMPRAR